MTFESLLELKEKGEDDGEGEGDETGFVEAFAKLDAGLASSAGFFSALEPEAAAACFGALCV